MKSRSLYICSVEEIRDSIESVVIHGAGSIESFASSACWLYTDLSVGTDSTPTGWSIM